MLGQFVNEHRDEIITRCRARVAARSTPRPTPAELDIGIPLFLTQLETVLQSERWPDPEVTTTASQHGRDMLRQGFTVGQVVHDYGDVCQTITELALERQASIGTDEFRALNLCLDNAIAEAVTEYERQREVDATKASARHSTEDMGFLAHELRNLLGAALLAFEAIQNGNVGIQGSTGAVLGRSLLGLRDLVDRSIMKVRLDAGIDKPERVAVGEFIDEIEVTASLSAKASGHELTVTQVEPGLTVDADRQILASVVTNLLQNAFKYSQPHGHVSLHTHATADRVLFEVEDQCGGLPPGKAEHLFDAFDQRSENRTGLGLGLAICARGVDALHGTLRVSNHPGRGCVFTIDLPRAEATASPG